MTSTIHTIESSILIRIHGTAYTPNKTEEGLIEGEHGATDEVDAPRFQGNVGMRRRRPVKVCLDVAKGMARRQGEISTINRYGRID